MTRNDELNAGLEWTLTAEWALLKVAEWREASAAVTLSILQGEVPDTQAAQDRFQMALAGVCGLGGEELRVLAAEVVQREAKFEALTLERDRLAHELRLLREAVGAPAWTTIPLDLARAVLTVGRAQWGVTVTQDAEAHGAMMAQSVRLTAEHFQQGDEAQAMQVVFLEGTDVVIAYTGTSPYSGTTAQGMTAAWNRLHEDCAEAVAHASLSSDTPERSGGEG